ncbi:MAG: hypothetical protein ABSC42_14735 [Tepidisphaeraceae bacterium]|jgi:hypothetical protein
MSSDDHLNSTRIRQMAALRRAAIRSRSYCVIALGGCVVGAAQCAFEGVRRWPTPASFRGILVCGLFMLSAAALMVVGLYFLRLARRFHRQARQSAILPPEVPPDFSKLQDGSQIVKNLEEM